jgi:hypothetical protein
MRIGRFFDPFDLFGPARAAGPVNAGEVLSNPKLCASMVGMFAAGIDTDEIGKRLVIPEHVVERVLNVEREKQRGMT